MYSEANRRETFTSWPHVGYRWAQPDPMAQAGFYHQVKGLVLHFCLLGEQFLLFPFFFSLIIDSFSDAKTLKKENVIWLYKFEEFSMP